MTGSSFTPFFGSVYDILTTSFPCKIGQTALFRFEYSSIFVGHSHSSCFIYQENWTSFRWFFWKSCLWMWSSWNFAGIRHLYHPSSFSSSSYFFCFLIHFVLWAKSCLLPKTLVNPRKLMKTCLTSHFLICKLTVN